MSNGTSANSSNVTLIGGGLILGGVISSACRATIESKNAAITAIIRITRFITILQFGKRLIDSLSNHTIPEATVKSKKKPGLVLLGPAQNSDNYRFRLLCFSVTTFAPVSSGLKNRSVS